MVFDGFCLQTDFFCDANLGGDFAKAFAILPFFLGWCFFMHNAYTAYDSYRTHDTTLESGHIFEWVVCALATHTFLTVLCSLKWHDNPYRGKIKCQDGTFFLCSLLKIIVEQLVWCVFSFFWSLSFWYVHYHYFYDNKRIPHFLIYTVWIYPHFFQYLDVFICFWRKALEDEMLKRKTLDAKMPNTNHWFWHWVVLPFKFAWLWTVEPYRCTGEDYKDDWFYYYNLNILKQTDDDDQPNEDKIGTPKRYRLASANVYFIIMLHVMFIAYMSGLHPFAYFGAALTATCHGPCTPCTPCTPCAGTNSTCTPCATNEGVEKAKQEANEAEKKAEKAKQEAKEAEDKAEKAKKEAKEAEDKAEKVKKEAKEAEDKAEADAYENDLVHTVAHLIWLGVVTVVAFVT
jgi:hypothetical protein